MSDFNSSLPVRTENPGDVIIKVSDATTPSQQMAVNVDGSINSVVSATNLDIRDLAFATDKVDVSGSSVTVDNGAGAAAVNIQDGGNSITVDGTVSISGSVTVTATDLDIRDLAFATDKVDVSGSSVSITGDVNVTATNLDIRDLSAATDNVAISDGTDTLAINPDGSINVNVITTSAGTPINNYKDASSIAIGATDDHDYTVTTGKTLTLNQIEASASGKAKMVVSVETGVASGTFNIVFAQFNSTAAPNMCIKLQNPILVAAGVRVRVSMTNKDTGAQDLYSTISGVEA